MANPMQGWRRFKSVSLVLIGWVCFLAAQSTENFSLKCLFLVAARALPPALGSGLPSETGSG